MILVYVKYCPNCGNYDKIFIDSEIFNEEDIKTILSNEEKCNNCNEIVNITNLDNFIKHNMNIAEVDISDNKEVMSKLKSSMLKQVNHMMGKM